MREIHRPAIGKAAITMHVFTPAWQTFEKGPEGERESAGTGKRGKRTQIRGTQRKRSLKPLKHSIVELILVFKR